MRKSDRIGEVEALEKWFSISALAVAWMSCFRRSELVPWASAYGLDMTDEMLALANENKRKAGADECGVPERRN